MKEHFFVVCFEIQWKVSRRWTPSLTNQIVALSPSRTHVLFYTEGLKNELQSCFRPSLSSFASKIYSRSIGNPTPISQILQETLQPSFKTVLKNIYFTKFRDYFRASPVMDESSATCRDPQPGKSTKKKVHSHVEIHGNCFAICQGAQKRNSL